MKNITGSFFTHMDINRESFLEKNINVNPDVAFYNPIRQKLADIEDKIAPVDFSKIEFKDEIENYSLKGLSPEAVEKIITIIKDDESKRMIQYKKQQLSAVQNFSDDDIDTIENMEKENLT